MNGPKGAKKHAVVTKNVTTDAGTTGAQGVHDISGDAARVFIKDNKQ